MVDRRDMVKALLGLPLAARKATLLGPALATLMAAQAARAEPVTIILAVAALLARYIASRNATDGGLMAMTVANHDLLMAALDKLNDIQNRLARIYQAIANLPDEIDKMLTAHEVRQFQNEITAVVIGYRELILNKDPAQPDEKWIQSASTQVRLRPLLNRLQQARQNLKVLDRQDPATALAVAPAGFVENSLLNLLQTPHKEIQNTLTSVYLDWFDAMANPKIVGSAAQYTLAATQRHNIASLAASESTIGKQLNFPAQQRNGSVEVSLGRRFDLLETRSTGLACGGLNDFTPGVEANCEPGGPPGHGGRAIKPDRTPVESDRLASVFGTPDPDEKTLLANPKLLNDNGWLVEAICRGGRAPRNGPHYRISKDVSLTEVELADTDGTPTGVMLWKFEQPPEKRFTGDGGAGGCEVVIEDANNDNDRAYNRIEQLSAFKTGDVNFAVFDKLIDQINLERARFAFGLEALSVAQTARDQLEKIIRSYG